MKVFVEGERDTFEVDDAGRGYHRTLLELRVWHASSDTMEEDLRTFLVADAGVAAALGARLVWGARPQDEDLPCAVLFRITGSRDYHMAGGSGLIESIVQIDVWAATWLAAKQAARAVAEALKPLAGTSPN